MVTDDYWWNIATNKTEHAVQFYAAGKTNKIAMLNKQC